MTDIRITIIDSSQSRKPPVPKQLAVIFVVLSALFGPGLLAGNVAMQWAGFCVCVLMFAATVKANVGDRMTIEDAREKLEALDAKAKAAAKAKAEAKAKAKAEAKTHMESAIKPPMPK
ncbi:hypothetical protein [Pseudovibrio sp. Tun.PSC04-5.I4]|uniref:hypothetical protein n=1 Tax=Pseudovibrio sp. Tun.PSC04-5.I4 TaxID=1798213 RepID=UPI00088B7542|nr:hypothetical protein [Pseudovibrio sp. Tun.PSC04-5.I4]SDR08171.1 hypothetical protein SAMN04515695_2657 [Pseudovibrio sp. Tun.PSC04-5.I4]